MVVLSSATEKATSAGLHRFHRDQVANLEILDALATVDDHAAQLVAEDDGILDAGERVRIAARGDGAVVVLVQIAAADAVVLHAQLDLADAGCRFRHIFEPEVLTPIENCRAHFVRFMPAQVPSCPA